MKVRQLNHGDNVVPFRAERDRPEHDAHTVSSDDIIRLLDLSKFERPNHSVENRDASMRANVAALILLGLLVFIGREDFCRLEQSNLCAARLECVN